MLIDYEATAGTNETEVQPTPVPETVKPTDEKPVEGAESTEAKAEEVKPETEEKKPEEDNSTIKAMRRQLKNQQKELAELRHNIAQSQVQPDPRPNRESYATDAEYVQAEVAYQVKQQVQVPKAQAPDTLTQKFEEARKIHEDFDDALTDIEHVQFKPEAQNAIREAVEVMEFGGEVLYHIAKNPDLAESLSILPPAAFAAKLGEIHGDIRRAKTTKPQQSRAPAPIAPVSGNTKPEKNYDDMDMDEFIATRQKERSAHRLRYVKQT